jgi:hypothetical protein
MKRALVIAATVALASATAVPAVAEKTTTESGVLPLSSFGTITFSHPFYNYRFGTVEFEGADVLGATITSAHSFVEWDPSGSEIVDYVSSCTAAVGHGCASGGVSLNVTSSVVGFYLPSTRGYGMLDNGRSGQKLIPVVGPDRTLELEFAPQAGATEIRYTLISTFGGVPEPASWALMLAGFCIVGLALRRGCSTSSAPAAI